MDPREARFEALVDEVMEPVRRYLTRRAPHPLSTDDVLADTLLVCWRRLDEVPDPALPWVYGVARHCLANAERGARRQRRLLAKVSVLDPPPETVPEPAEDPRAEAVRTAITQLRPVEAELIRLWAWEELAPAEIAVTLGITPNAASIRLHRAREHLRDRLRKVGVVSGHEEVTERRRP